MAIANALQLEAARRRASLSALISFPVPSLNSLSLSVAVLERFYCSKAATDRLSEFKLATGDEVKADRDARRRAASSCNAFAIATFSSCFLLFSNALFSAVRS